MGREKEVKRQLEVRGTNEENEIIQENWDYGNTSFIRQTTVKSEYIYIYIIFFFKEM